MGSTGLGLNTHQQFFFPIIKLADAPQFEAFLKCSNSKLSKILTLMKRSLTSTLQV